MRQNYFIFCIDVEPHHRTPAKGARSEWDSFEDAFQLFEEWRGLLAQATKQPVNFNWFLRLDPQIEQIFGSVAWVVDNYREIFNRILAAGDEIGIHLHAYRWDSINQVWFSDFADSNWIEHCIQTSVRAYRDVFRCSASAFRFGDRWMSNQTIESLEKAGIKYDLTLEPGTKSTSRLSLPEPATQDLPDYRNTPRRPYQPSVTNYLCPGQDDKRKIWMIPVSASPARWHLSRRWPFLHSGGYQLNLALSTFRQTRLINHLMSAKSSQLIVALFRTGDLAEEQYRNNFIKNLRAISHHPRLETYNFTTP
ncbi:MAG TPA: hypothetical protein VEF04_18645, partial [Blastocatellia bacterium]|nr:hypothetical protein [Blastocatellia bacterium]